MNIAVTNDSSACDKGPLNPRTSPTVLAKKASGVFWRVLYLPLAERLITAAGLGEEQIASEYSQSDAESL